MIADVVSEMTAPPLGSYEVMISLSQSNSTFCDASATLPNGITPTHPDWPAHWPKEELELSAFTTAYTAWLASQP